MWSPTQNVKNSKWELKDHIAGRVLALQAANQGLVPDILDDLLSQLGGIPE